MSDGDVTGVLVSDTLRRTVVVDIVGDIKIARVIVHFRPGGSLDKVVIRSHSGYESEFYMMSVIPLHLRDAIDRFIKGN